MVRSIHESNLHGTPHSTHDAEALHSIHPEAQGDEWREPRNLDAPPSREGYVQRWIRVEDRAGKDALNLANKQREGWRPRPLETIPEQFKNFPIGKHASLGDVLMVGGCVLMEMPIHIAESRNRQVRARIARQNKAVASDADEVSRAGVRRGMAPLVREEVQKVTHRAPAIQED